MAILRNQFALALNQVCSERGIEPESVFGAIKEAYATAYRKHLLTERVAPEMIPLMEQIRVEIDEDTGEAKIFVEDKEVTPPDFGRIAAQTAKQVILQKVREAEKDAIITDFKEKIGQVINGMILRFEGQNISVQIEKAECIMPMEEQNHGERYNLNQRLSFYVVEIRDGLKGQEVIVSRAHPQLISGLFNRVVPELQNGSITVKEIAREPGVRTKIAVLSNQSGVDACGACIGQKGVRVNMVLEEVGAGERIDIVQWSEEPEKYIASALAPAKEIEIEANPKTKSAIAYVPDDQLSLAIGKDGQNVRAAVKLTGYKIDIKPKSQKVVVPVIKIPKKKKVVSVASKEKKKIKK